MQESQNIPESTKDVTSTLLTAITGIDLFAGAVNSLTNSLNVLGTLDKTFSTLSQQLGVGSEFSEVIKNNLADGVIEVQKLGGSFADAGKIQQEFLNTYNRNVILQGDLIGDLFATSKVSGQAADKLLSSFADVGMSAKDITSEMSTVVDVSNQLGVNSQAVSSRVVSNLEKLNRYGFTNGVEGLSRMAAKAAVLRVDMQSTFDLADRLFSPEKAIELASSLQRLGVASTDLTDPLRLMDLAQNNVPELQKQLGEMFKQYTFFDEKAKKFQIFPEGRRIIRELSSELGMTVGEIEKMALGTSDLEKKLSEISFSGLDISEDTKEMVANMATLGAGGEYEITTKSGDILTLDKFLDSYKGKEEQLTNYFKDMEVESKKTPEEKMRELAEQQLGVLGKIDANIATLNSSIGLGLQKSGLGKTILDTALKRSDQDTKIGLETFGTESEVFINGLKEMNNSVDTFIDHFKSGDFVGLFKDVTKIMGDAGKIVIETFETYVESTAKNLFGVEINFDDAFNKYVEKFSSLTSENIINFLKNSKDSIISLVDDMYLDPKSNTFIQTDFGKIIPNTNDALLAAPKTQIQSILAGESPTSSAMTSIGGKFEHTFTVNVTGLSDINNIKVKTELEKLLTVDNGIKNAIVNAAKSSIDNKLNA